MYDSVPMWACKGLRNLFLPWTQCGSHPEILLDVKTLPLLFVKHPFESQLLSSEATPWFWPTVRACSDHNWKIISIIKDWFFKACILDHYYAWQECTLNISSPLLAHSMVPSLCSSSNYHCNSCWLLVAEPFASLHEGGTVYAWQF